LHKGIQQFARLHLLSQLLHNYLSSTCSVNQVRRSTRLNYAALHLYYTYYKNAIAIANLFSQFFFYRKTQWNFLNFTGFYGSIKRCILYCSLHPKAIAIIFTL
jgi:hypothetical protein